MRAGLAIRGIGVVAPIGIGWPAFAAALRADAAPPPRAASAALCGTTPWPAAPAHWVADFDARRWLGEKGVGALDRTTQLAVVACKEALQPLLGDAEGEAAREHIGVVLGTGGGGLRSIADFVRSTYTATPHMVSPMQFPNAVMNCAAGQCAIWHRLRGVNSTVCAGELSGLAALQYASRMLRRGHARALLAGAVEEFCDFTAWSHAATASPRPLGEGAAFFALGAAAAEAAAPEPELLAVGLRGVPVAAGAAPATPAALAEALAAEIGRALQACGVAAADLRWWSGSGDDALGAAERTALDRIGAGVVALPLRVRERCGHSHAASLSLQLAGALALAPPGPGLLTAVSAQGQVGCAVLRVPANGHAL